MLCVVGKPLGDSAGCHPAGAGTEAIGSAYAAGQTAEFVEPRIILNNGSPTGTINDGDGIIFFNFRADRAREITRAFTQ